MLRACAALTFAALAWTGALSALEASTPSAEESAELAAGVGADDECSGGASCSVNALQLRKQRSSVQAEHQVQLGALAVSTTQAALGTVGFDNGTAGLGQNGSEIAINRTGGTISAVKHVSEGASVANTSNVSWNPQHEALLYPSEAQVFTFYMYRAQSLNNYPIENVNAGNLDGILWYLQNEIVSGKWGSTDRFGIQQIRRIKVQTKATQPLIEKNMNFGLRVSFDSGRCTNGACDYNWWMYGFNVGCNNLGEYPFPMFETYYPGAIWYSLPGKCPSLPYSAHNVTCDLEQPGGRCSGTPTGAGNCTYSYEEAGNITLAELYGNQTSESFWAAASDLKANARKVTSAHELFNAKYPTMPSESDLAGPPCDFDQKRFFACTDCK